MSPFAYAAYGILAGLCIVALRPWVGAWLDIRRAARPDPALVRRFRREEAGR